MNSPPKPQVPGRLPGRRHLTLNNNAKIKQNALIKLKEDKTACKSLQQTYEKELKEQKHYNDNPNIYKGVKRPFAFGPPPPECDKYLTKRNAITYNNLRKRKNRTRKQRK